MFWIDGRIAWPVVCAAVFSTFVLLLADFIWRTVQMPASMIAGAVAGLLLIGNAAILIIGPRLR